MNEPSITGVGTDRPIYTLPACLTIAGSDSGGGAGIQADLKTFQANGVFGLSVITALTAQNTQAVVAAHDVPAEFVRTQLAAVWEDFPIAAFKTGMLSSAALVRTVATFVRDLPAPRPPLVVDPVMISKSGFALLAPDAVEAVSRELLPLATVVTPNRHEAELLAGMHIAAPEDLLTVASRILALGAASVVLKGGHLDEAEAADYLYARSSHGGVELVRRFASPRWDTRATHGTGCTFSAALCARLGRGDSLVVAVEAAKTYVAEAIRYGLALGSGHGPTDHFYFLRAWYQGKDAAP